MVRPDQKKRRHDEEVAKEAQEEQNKAAQKEKAAKAKQAAKEAKEAQGAQGAQIRDPIPEQRPRSIKIGFKTLRSILGSYFRSLVVVAVFCLGIAIFVQYNPDFFTKWTQDPVDDDDIQVDEIPVDDIPGPKLKCASSVCTQDEYNRFYISQFTWQMKKIAAKQEPAGVGVYSKENGIYRGHCPGIFSSISNFQILVWPTCPFNESDTHHLVVYRCYNYDQDNGFPGTYRILKTSQNPSLPIQYAGPGNRKVPIMTYTPPIHDGDCTPLRVGELVNVTQTKLRLRIEDAINPGNYIEKDVYIHDFDHAFRKEVLPIEGTPLYQYLPSWTEDRPDVNLIGRTLHERRKEILQADPEAPIVSIVHKKYDNRGKLLFKMNCAGTMIGNKRAYIGGFCSDLSNVEMSALNKYIIYNCYFHDSTGLPTFERVVIAAPYKVIDTTTSKLKPLVSFTDKPKNCEIIWASKEKIIKDLKI